MKKFALFFTVAFLFSSCDIDDGGPNIAYEFAKVIEADLPESFEFGKVYEIDVTYLLPTACHFAAGLEVSRGGLTGNERSEIYVAAISSYNTSVTNCDENGSEEARTKIGRFSLLVDETPSYTFYFLTGTNSNGQNQYMIMEVPVTSNTPGD